MNRLKDAIQMSKFHTKREGMHFDLPVMVCCGTMAARFGRHNVKIRAHGTRLRSYAADVSADIAAHSRVLASDG